MLDYQSERANQSSILGFGKSESKTLMHTSMFEATHKIEKDIKINGQET